MAKRMWICAIGLILVGAFAGSCGESASSEDDVPPIIVKSGSIDFTTAATWKKTLVGNHWKAERANAKDVQEFEVKVTQGGSNCATMKGTTVLIDFAEGSASRQFTIGRSKGLFARKHVPRLDPPVDLTQNAGTLTYGAQGYISRLEVRGTTDQTCTFSANPVEIHVCSNACRDQAAR